MDTKLKPETLAAQALRQTDSATGGVTPAIHTASTFIRDANYELVSPDRSYGRDENPGFVVAENVLAELEGGADALLFSSGMAAAMGVLQALRPGDRIVAPRVMYWGLRNWMTAFCETWGLGLELFDASDPDALAKTVRAAKTRLVWIETPCNPTWDVIDIAAAADIAREARALIVVDSTVATPVLTRPLDLGADIVMHSATKYLNGHCDIVSGALVSAQHDAFWAQVRNARIHAGAIPGAFDAWLLQRGLRTLFLRVRRASESALAIAQHFETHPALTGIAYPGLPGHAGHAIAARQMTGGFGGMLSLRVAGGEAAALDVAKRCRVFTRATSLGGVESLVEHRWSIEGPDSPVPRDLLRLSVGIEDAGDLVADLEQALAPHSR